MNSFAFSKKGKAFVINTCMTAKAVPGFPVCGQTSNLVVGL